MIDYFFMKARQHCDIGTSERILNDMAETKIRIPAIFSEQTNPKPDLEYIEYEVLPEVESLINETVKVLK